MYMYVYMFMYMAIQQYIEYSGDWDFVQAELYDDLKDIIHAHQRGTRYGISMADDGLIQGGDSDTQLTWMDVQFDGYAVTPRYGKAVEINALWYNALCFAQQCCSGDFAWDFVFVCAVEEVLAKASTDARGRYVTKQMCM